MPYVADGSLEDMVNVEACSLTARDIADDGLDAFEGNVRRNTPIDTSPFRDRPGRPRGALRDSIHRTPVNKTASPAGPAYRGRVETEDPVGPNVEWDTAPHVIEPRDPDGVLHWRDRITGEDRFAKRVEHPGTIGAHMFSIGAAITEHELEHVAAPALRRWESAFTRSTIVVTDRRAR